MALMIQRGNELLLIDTGKNEIVYSTNSGRNWYTRFNDSKCGVLYDLFDNGREILCCCSKGIYYSDNDGRNWYCRYGESNCGTFCQLFLNGNEILAITSKGLYYSTNDGRNWYRR